MLKIDICAHPEVDWDGEPHYKTFHHFIIKRKAGGALHRYGYKVIDEDGLTVLEGEYDDAHPSIVKRVLKDCLNMMED